DQLGLELWRLWSSEAREDVPVLHRDELLDLPLSIAHELQRDRLHASGAQPSADLVPQEGADLVADESIEDAARALGVDHVLIDVFGMLERFLNGRLGNLVE